MTDARIREILGLNADVEITDEHRGQALQKLDEQVQELETGAEAVTEATGTEDLPAAAAALTEGNLPGRVVLAEADHQRMVQAETELKALKEGQEGTVTLTEAQHTELKAGAEAGVAAGVRLAEMRADTAISDAVTKDHRMLNDGAKAIARKTLIADYDAGVELLKSYPVMSAEMLEEAGDTGMTSGSADVKAFIAEKIKDGAMTLGEAMKEAREQFAEDQVKAYEFGDQAAAA